MSEQLAAQNLLHTEVSDTVENLASKIAYQTESQINSWRRLPRLALLADGRTGFSSDLAKLYTWGLAPINSKTIGIYGLLLDCTSGIISSYSGGHDRIVKPKPAELIGLYMDSPSIFDAQSWIDDYNNMIAKPVSPAYEAGGKISATRARWLAEQEVFLDLIPNEFTLENAVRLREYVDTLPVEGFY